MNAWLLVVLFVITDGAHFSTVSGTSGVFPTERQCRFAAKAAAAEPLKVYGAEYVLHTHTKCVHVNKPPNDG